MKNFSVDRDLATACGAFDLPLSKVADAVQMGINDQRQSARPASRPADPPKSRFVEIGQFLQRPPSTHWLIRDFVCTDITMVFFGEPSSGKSLVLIDMACHIATGRDWCGHKTTEGLVLYICGEGQHGLSKRFMAWFQHYGETPRNLHLSLIHISEPTRPY